MPVDYTIAARNAQLNNTPTDFTNMLAQYQMMGSRAQQNELAQLQMQKLQQEQQQQNALRGILSQPGFDLNSPAATRALLGAGLFDEPLKLQAAQDTRALHQAARQNYESEIQARTGLTAAQIDKYGAETEKEAALARKAKLEEDAAHLTKAREGASLVLSQGGKGFDRWKANLPPELAPYAPDNFDPETMSGFATTLATHQDAIKGVNDFDYQKVKKFDGSEVIVAIPKHAPEKGAKAVPGTEGLPTSARIQTQLAGPSAPGAILQSDESGNAWLAYPAQPGQRPVTTGVPVPSPAPGQPKQGLRVDMNAPPSAPQNAGMIGIRSAAPLGSPERGRQDVMQQILTSGAYNPDTGVDLIEPTLGRASSGMLSAKGTDIARKFGRDSAAARADTDLKRISADLTQAFAGNRLATAGVAASEADRFEKQAGDIGNSNLTIGERLNAYRSIKRNATRLLGVEYKNPYDPQGIKTENVMRQRVEESPNGFTVTDPDGGTHTFGDRKQAAEFLSHIQRMEVGKR